jgi:hypothetical protein
MPGDGICQPVVGLVVERWSLFVPIGPSVFAAHRHIVARRPSAIRLGGTAAYNCWSTVRLFAARCIGAATRRIDLLRSVVVNDVAEFSHVDMFVVIILVECQFSSAATHTTASLSEPNVSPTATRPGPPTVTLAIVDLLKKVSWGARDQVMPSGEVQTRPPLSDTQGR